MWGAVILIRHRAVSRAKDKRVAARDDISSLDDANSPDTTTSTASTVMVVDYQRQYLESVPAALARMALKSGKAKILYKEPCTIQLVQGLQRCPRPVRASQGTSKSRRGASQSHVEVFYGAINSMSNGNNTVKASPGKAKAASTYQSPVAATRLVDEYFKAYPDEVWARATTNAQVILSSQRKDQMLGVPPIAPGEPVLLTRYASVEDLKKSDLRHMVMQGRLRLMTPDEAQQYFEDRAQRRGESVETVRRKAEQREAAFLNHEPAALRDNNGRRRDQTADDIMGKKLSGRDDMDGEQDPARAINPVLIASVIDPKVEYLCAMSSPKQPASVRKTASDLQDEFRCMEESLSMDDLEHIVATVPYKTVRNWATQRQEFLAGEEFGDGAGDEAGQDQDGDEAVE